MDSIASFTSNTKAQEIFGGVDKMIHADNSGSAQSLIHEPSLRAPLGLHVPRNGSAAGASSVQVERRLCRIDIETTSKPFAEYRTDGWTDTGLSRAPAIMVGEEVVTEGSDVAKDKVVGEFRKQLGMSLL